MSIEYIIAPSEEKLDFAIDPEYLKIELLKRWPNAQVWIDNTDSPEMGWSVYLDEYLLVGEYVDEKKMLVVNSPIIYAAQFAIWYRQFVPANYKLLIVDFLGNKPSLEITSETTEAEVVNAFLDS